MILIANGEKKKKKGHATGRFLHHHALGLMARLTDVINDISVMRAPIHERRRCIAAMEEMIRIGRNDVRIARPQVSNDIQTGLVGHILI
jgi:serine/threonine-protein kinase ATR